MGVRISPMVRERLISVGGSSPSDGPAMLSSGVIPKAMYRVASQPDVRRSGYTALWSNDRGARLKIGMFGVRIPGELRNPAARKVGDRKSSVVRVYLLVVSLAT